MKIPTPERSVFGDLPTGFGMALMNNREAYNRFFLLPEEERQNIVDGVHGISSKTEMRDYVSRSLLGDDFTNMLK
jgi:hypothetical protein